MPPGLRITFVSVVVTLLLSLPAVPAPAQTAQQERVAASFVLALGRTPSPAELEEWSTPDAPTLADLIARHRKRLQDAAAARGAVGARAVQDALGAAPGGDRGAAAPAESTYAELVQWHLERLAGNADEYGQVVHRAYRLVLQRDAYDVEIRYWAQRRPLSFVLLAGCVDDWARRNQPGLMATTGVAAVSINSRYLSTVRLSPAVAREARAALGIAPAGSAALASATGRFVLAPGAADLVSVGGIHFAAAGAPERPVGAPQIRDRGPN